MGLERQALPCGLNEVLFRAQPSKPLLVLVHHDLVQELSINNKRQQGGDSAMTIIDWVPIMGILGHELSPTITILYRLQLLGWQLGYQKEPLVRFADHFTPRWLEVATRDAAQQWNSSMLVTSKINSSNGRAPHPHLDPSSRRGRHSPALSQSSGYPKVSAVSCPRWMR